MPSYNFDNYTTVEFNGTEMFKVKYGTITVYAKPWVTFIENGGSSVSDQYYFYNRTYGYLPYITRSNYIFNGSYTSSAYTTQVLTTHLVTQENSHTLYAKWSGAPRTVYFNSRGGSTPSPTSKTVYYGNSYGTLPTVSASNYSFDGWYTAVPGGSLITQNTQASISSNQTLYAKWTFQSQRIWASSPTSIYEGTVTLNTGTMNTTAVTGMLTDAYPPSNYYGGYVMRVRCYSFDGSSYLGVAYRIINNTSAPNYTITFNAANGTTPSPTTKSVAYLSTYGTLPTTSRSGYTFNGWYTASSGGTQVLSSTVMNQIANHTLYAQWIANSYSWIYYSEDSSEPPISYITLTNYSYATRISQAKDFLESQYPASNYQGTYMAVYLNNDGTWIVFYSGGA